MGQSTTDAPSPIRALIADDHLVVRRGIGALLASISGIEVVAGDQVVEFGDRRHRRDRDEVAAAEPADLTLDPALLVCSLHAGAAEEAVERVLATQRDEPLGLGAVSAPQHAYHRRLEVVVSDQAGHPVEVFERTDVTLQKGLLGLVAEGHVKRAARVGQLHHEHPHLHVDPVEQRVELTEINLRFGTVIGIRGRDVDSASTVERARVVIGADGRNSRVARSVGAASYHEKAPLQIGYYSYWRDLEVDGFETYIRPDRGFAAIPTNDDLTLIVAGWPIAEREANRVDIEGNFYSTMDLVPAFAERVRAATRVERFVGGSVPNYFRQTHGPGWLLIGDASYCKDPITAQGIKDAFHDAETCATALGTVLRGEGDFEPVMSDRQRARDEAALPIYGLTTEFATLEPPQAQTQQLFAAMQGNQAAMDDFVGVIAGTVSPVDFFHPDHIGQIFAAAHNATAAAMKPR